MCRSKKRFRYARVQKYNMTLPTNLSSDSFFFLTSFFTWTCEAKDPDAVSDTQIAWSSVV